MKFNNFHYQKDPNANKFVNQGYNEYEYPTSSQRSYTPQPQQQQQQQPALQSGTRIIPIQMEGSRSPQMMINNNNNENTIVMQR